MTKTITWRQDAHRATMTYADERGTVLSATVQADEYDGDDVIETLSVALAGNIPGFGDVMKREAITPATAYNFFSECTQLLSGCSERAFKNIVYAMTQVSL